MEPLACNDSVTFKVHESSLNVQTILFVISGNIHVPFTGLKNNPLEYLITPLTSGYLGNKSKSKDRALKVFPSYTKPSIFQSIWRVSAAAVLERNKANKLKNKTSDIFNLESPLVFNWRLLLYSFAHEFKE